jgi:hypothetical protein
MHKNYIPRSGDKIVYNGPDYPTERGKIQTVKQVTKDTSRNTYRIVTDLTEFDTIGIYYKDCEVTSTDKLKLEGYRLIKLYPTCKFKLGVLLVENQHDPCCWCLKQYADWENQSAFENLSGCHITPFPEHWEPVYKIVEKTVTIGDRDLRITDKGEIIGQFKYTIENWEDLYNYLTKAFGMHFKGDMTGSDAYQVKVTAVSMGCVHNVSLADIKLVIDEYYRLNPKTT